MRPAPVAVRGTNLLSLPASSSSTDGGRLSSRRRNDLGAGRHVCGVFLNAHARSRGMNSEPAAASAEPIESREIVPDRDGRTLKTQCSREVSSANVPCRHSAWLTDIVLPPRKVEPDQTRSRSHKRIRDTLSRRRSTPRLPNGTDKILVSRQFVRMRTPCGLT